MPIGASARLEAKYQWRESLTLKPDKDLIATIDKKLKDGLADTPATKRRRIRTCRRSPTSEVFGIGGAFADNGAPPHGE